MKLKTLTVKKFRGLADLTLDFHPRLTVLVGENGIGKTSILDALAILLDQYVARFVRARAQTAMQVKESDLHRSSNSAHPITTVIKLQTEVGTGEVVWSVAAQNREARLAQAISSEMKELNDHVQQKVQEDGTSLEGEPLIIYFGQQRAIIDVLKKNRIKIVWDLINAFQDALNSRRSHFRDFAEWFRDQDHADTQSIVKTLLERLSKSDSLSIDGENSQNSTTPVQTAADASSQLQVVVDAFRSVTGFSNICYITGKSKGIYIAKRGENVSYKQVGYLDSITDDENLYFNIESLSSGEQILISLSADLARRLAMLNPNLANPLDGEGIVLIDEIELHLHPGWQRMVLPNLLKTFRNCQFVVTTHSPQVLGEVEAESIRILRADEDGRITVYGTDASYGRDSNFLLLSVLGADDRDLELKNKLKELDRLITDNELDAAKSLLNIIEDGIEGSPAELYIFQAKLERQLARQKGTTG